MFPLREKKLIRGCQAHINAGLLCGADYVANYVPFFIPFDGIAQTYKGTQGGNWLRIVRPNGDKIELAHLSKYSVENNKPVRAGQLGGVTGNTGQVTTGPHLHIQIINKAGKRLDPEKYNWEEGNMAQIKTQAKGASRRLVLEAATEAQWIELCAVYGKDPNVNEENVKDV